MSRFILLFFLLLGVTSAIGEEPPPEPEQIPISRASVSHWQDDVDVPAHRDPRTGEIISATFARFAEFHYKKAFDGKMETSWGTGGSFYARKKEWIILFLDRPVYVTQIKIAPGLQPKINPKNPGYAFTNFIGNGRPKDLTLTFSDNSKQYIFMKDFKSEKEFGFQTSRLVPVYTSWIWIQIDDIFPGDTSDLRTQDFGIAEIEVYGYDSLPTQE